MPGGKNPNLLSLKMDQPESMCVVYCNHIWTMYNVFRLFCGYLDWKKIHRNRGRSVGRKAFLFFCFLCQLLFWKNLFLCKQILFLLKQLFLCVQSQNKSCFFTIKTFFYMMHTKYVLLWLHVIYFLIKCLIIIKESVILILFPTSIWGFNRYF